MSLGYSTVLIHHHKKLVQVPLLISSAWLGCSAFIAKFFTTLLSSRSADVFEDMRRAVMHAVRLKV